MNVESVEDISSRPFVLIHLARCGGSALGKLLDLHYPNSRMLKCNLVQEEAGRPKGVNTVTSMLRSGGVTSTIIGMAMGCLAVTSKVNQSSSQP